jgi:NAD(P)-dependent dehydrogenase (short-subunit alcohol dehydrogenase family)
MEAHRPDLKGKVALVTGGSRGLGREMALALAAAGADVIVASRNLDACRAVADEVEALGRSALPHACHVGRWDDIDDLVDASYARFGRVDVLVNNAGKSPPYPSLTEVTEAMFDSVIGLNLKGPFRLSVLIGTQMCEGAGGTIVNISSIASLRPRPGVAPYAAAKAGLNATTIALAHAFAPKVRVNAIVPGGFRTDISRHWTPEFAEDLARQAALGRLGEPGEIVGAALFLASDASSFTTGALLTVDGGTA